MRSLFTSLQNNELASNQDQSRLHRQSRYKLRSTNVFYKNWAKKVFLTHYLTMQLSCELYNLVVVDDCTCKLVSAHVMKTTSICRV